MMVDRPLKREEPLPKKLAKKWSKYGAVVVDNIVRLGFVFFWKYSVKGAVAVVVVESIVRLGFVFFWKYSVKGAVAVVVVVVVEALVMVAVNLL